MTTDQHAPGFVAILTQEWLWTQSAAAFVHLAGYLPVDSRMFFTAGSHSIAAKRNACVATMLADPRMQWLLFIDADAVPPPETPMTLLEHQVEMVAASFVNREPPYANVYDGPLGTGPRGLFEVEAVGFHCVLLRRSLLERMPSPWFDHGATPDRGEDWYFCQQARAAGAQVYIDRTLAVGHISLTNVTPQHALEYQQTPTGRWELARYEAATTAARSPNGS